MSLLYRLKALSAPDEWEDKRLRLELSSQHGAVREGIFAGSPIVRPLDRSIA
jgi:hypothetical protein